MSKTKAQRQPWTKGEKFILGAILLTVVVAALGTLHWRQVNINPVVVIPVPVMPVQNAFDYFNVAAASEVDVNKMRYALGRHTNEKPSKSDPFDHYYTFSEKKALVAENAAALTQLRQGLCYPYQNPPIRSFYNISPDYMKFRNLAGLLKMEGRVQEGQGNWGGAVNSNLNTVQMCEMIPHGGTTFRMEIGIVCEAIGRRPIWSEVSHLSAMQARAAVRRLEKIEQIHVPLADTLQETEWCTQASLLEIFHHPTWRAELAVVLTGDGMSDLEVTPQLTAQLRFASQRAIMSGYTAAMDERIRYARQPYSSSAPALPPDEIVREIIGDDLAYVLCMAADNEAQNAMLMTTLALRAYQLDHGGYPPTLNALVPGYLPRVPDDPFTVSGPLHYRRQGSNYVLYSIGPDGNDDGGSRVFMVEPDSKGDIVAGVNGV